MFLVDWGNKSKNMLLDLIDSVSVGLIFGLLACIFLVVDGKYGVDFYRSIANICGIVLFCLLAFGRIVRGTLETTEDLKAKKEILEIELKIKELAKSD